MADRTSREFGTTAPAGYVGDFLQNTIFPSIGANFSRYYDNQGKANSTPFTYTGNRISGFDPRESYAMSLSDSAVGNYRPYLDAAGRTINKGMTAADTAAGVGSNYMREGNQAGRGLTNLSANMYQGLGAQFDPSSYQSYMNPYMDSVVDSALGDIRKQNDVSRGKFRDDAVTSGAFGGSRGRIGENDIYQSGVKQMGETAGALRQSGFANAMNSAYTDFAREQGEKANTAGALGGLGQQAYGMGLGTGQGIAGIGQGLAGTYGTSAGGLSALGGQFANLSREDINRLMQTGAMGRGLSQSQNDLDYSNFVGEYNMPNTILGNTISAVGAAGPMAGGFSYAGANPTDDMTGGFGSNFFPSTAGIGSYGTPGTGLTGYTGGMYGNNLPV